MIPGALRRVDPSRNHSEVDVACASSLQDVGQFTGAGASILRFALFGSKGTSWTAIVEAGTEPSFPDDVHVTVTAIDEDRGRLPWDKCVGVRDAVAVVLRYGSSGNNNQTVARVGVPSGAGDHTCWADRLPQIALHI